MKCLNCMGEEIEVQNLRFSPKIKNTAIDVIVPCNICKNCKTSQMDNSQMNALRRLTADKYREENDLLTSRQIIKYRTELKMSQQAFARFLNVGEASIKRWETYYVQDESQDDHIRLKCDEKYAEMNYLTLQWRSWKPDIYTGGKSFSLDVYKNIDAFFLQSIPICKGFLSVLHFYADFLHHKRCRVGISGNKYVTQKQGPSPYLFNTISKMTSRSGNVSSLVKHFDDSERETMGNVCELFSKRGGEEMQHLSNREHGYVNTQDSEYISYKYSSALLL